MEGAGEAKTATPSKGPCWDPILSYVILKPLNIGKTCKNLALYLEHWLRNYLVTLIIFLLTPTHHPPGITYDKKVMLQKGIFDKIFQQLIFNDISVLLINEAFPYLRITNDCIANTAISYQDHLLNTKTLGKVSQNIRNDQWPCYKIFGP